MTLEPLEVRVALDVPPETAFRAFTDQVAQWWPSHILSVGAEVDGHKPEQIIIEPHPDGEIYEVSPAGVKRLWGHVTQWQPPEMLSFTWHPGKEGALATDITVRFDLSDTGGTSVTLVHSKWEVLGAVAEEIRGNYESGWGMTLGSCYADFVGAAR